jgi:hypothetical protein
LRIIVEEATAMKKGKRLHEAILVMGGALWAVLLWWVVVNAMTR